MQIYSLLLRDILICLKKKLNLKIISTPTALTLKTKKQNNTNHPNDIPYIFIRSSCIEKKV